MSMNTLNSLLVSLSFSSAGTLTGAALTRYLDQAGYRRTLTGSVADLPPAAQQAFAAVVTHAQQLRAADERIATVFGELAAPVPDQSHTETDPDTGEARPVIDSYRQQVNLALTLRKLDGSGERTIAITTEALPTPARDAVLQLWALLAQ